MWKDECVLYSRDSVVYWESLIRNRKTMNGNKKIHRKKDTFMPFKATTLPVFGNTQLSSTELLSTPSQGNNFEGKYCISPMSRITRIVMYMWSLVVMYYELLHNNLYAWF